MNERQFQEAMHALYDESREDTIGAMIDQFFSRRMLGTAVLVWGNFLLFFACAVVVAALFVYTSQVKWQIGCAALFVSSLQLATLGKVFAWQALNRNSIKREIKRLELRIAELAAAEK